MSIFGHFIPGDRVIRVARVRVSATTTFFETRRRLQAEILGKKLAYIQESAKRREKRGGKVIKLSLRLTPIHALMEVQCPR